MKKPVRYCLSHLLLASYALVILSGQFMALGKLLNSSAGSTISSETSPSVPFDGRLTFTQWKHVVPAFNSDPFPESTGSDRFIVPSEQNEIVTLPITYTTVVSHFPYPPFWPRDPSLS